MKITYHTNIDAYQNSWFPTNNIFVPRKGEFVYVKEDLINHLAGLKLPRRLEVVSVSYYEDKVICELWYNKVDKELADLAGAKTL